MLRSPAVADPLQEIGAYIRFRMSASAKLKEFAIIMVARFWGAEFEWHIHRNIAEAEGLEPKKINAILRGKRPASLDNDEAEVYRFMAELLLTGRVTDSSFDSMTQRFGERIVTDFITLAGYYTTVSFFLNVDRHPLPDGVEPMPRLTDLPFNDIFANEGQFIK